MASRLLLKVYHIINATFYYVKPQLRSYQCSCLFRLSRPLQKTVNKFAESDSRLLFSCQITLPAPVTDTYRTFLATMVAVISVLSLLRYSTVTRSMLQENEGSGQSCIASRRVKLGCDCQRCFSVITRERRRGRRVTAEVDTCQIYLPKCVIS